MANPNIAAISELHVGTMGFNLKTTGATFVSPRVVQSGTTSSWDHPTATSIYGYTLANTLMLCGQAYDSGRSTSGITYNSDAMTKVFESAEYETGSQSGSLYYRVNPDIGDYDVSASMGGSGNFTSISSFWGNIDQTTPLKIMDGSNWQGTVNEFDFGKLPHATSTISGQDNLQTYQEGSRAKLFNMMDQGCEPGDVGILQITHDGSYAGIVGYANTTLLGSMNTASDGHHDYLQQFIISPDGGKNISPHRIRNFHGGYNSGSTGHSDPLCASLIILQSSRTEDTLITCPAERVLKINSIMATNPESLGIHVNVSLGGLGAVNDTGGAAAATPTGNDASVRIAQGVKVPMGKAIELLQRPIYMIEGDILTANAKSTGFMPQDANRGVDIVVSFESMED